MTTRKLKNKNIIIGSNLNDEACSDLPSILSRFPVFTGCKLKLPTIGGETTEQHHVLLCGNTAKAPIAKTNALALQFYVTFYQTHSTGIVYFWRWSAEFHKYSWRSLPQCGTQQPELIWLSPQPRFLLVHINNMTTYSWYKVLSSSSVICYYNLAFNLQMQALNSHYNIDC